MRLQCFFSCYDVKSTEVRYGTSDGRGMESSDLVSKDGYTYVGDQIKRETRMTILS